MNLKPADQCRYDLVALGECMVRLSPPDRGRIEHADHLEVHVGGAEYNVAYALSRWGDRTAWVGGVNDGPLGRRVLNHARSAGVDVAHAVARPFDGAGKVDRVGLNFTEVGGGLRPSMSVYDRGHSVTADLGPGDVDWPAVFGGGVRWFHTGGIFTCLSDRTRAAVAEAIRAAKEAGCFVSYDLNFRSKLWTSEAAVAATRPLVPMIDALIGNEEDFQKVLGYDVAGADVEGGGDVEIEGYKAMARRVARDFENVKLVATTLRRVVSADANDWSALAYFRDEDGFFEGPSYEAMPVVDRVGGGDGFASGLIHALLRGDGPQAAVNFGTAHGALVQTTRGDTTQATADEVARLAAGGGARIVR